MADNKIFTELIQRIATNEQIQQPNIQIQEFTTKGANLSSKIYRINIDDEKNKTTLKLFAKIASVTMEMRESFVSFQPFETEKIAYTTLFKVYRGLEEKYGIPEIHKLVLPKFYGEDSTLLQETIVLEDLGCKGFELYSRFKSVDWPYAAAAVTELAKFHALSFIYEHEDPDEFQEMVNRLLCVEFPDNDATKSSCKHSAELAIDAVHEDRKEKLARFLDGLSMKSFSDLPRVSRRRVLVHADFRPSNMLYRKGHDGGTEVIPVDYQSIQAGCPVADLVYFLMCGSDGPFRAQYYQPLVNLYYSELTASLARFGLDVENIYPREDFEFELKQKLPHGLKIAVIVMPYMMTPEDKAMEADNFSYGKDHMGDNTCDSYKTRISDLVDDFETWGLLPQKLHRQNGSPCSCFNFCFEMMCFQTTKHR